MKKLLLILFVSLLTTVGMYAQTTVSLEGFTVNYDGVVYNGDGTSTWTYTVVGEGSPPALSHWVLGFCDDLTENNVVEILADGVPVPDGNWSVGPDGSAGGFYGLKYEVSVEPNETIVFSFTLNVQPAAGPIEALVKAGNAFETGFITGPTCEPYSAQSSIGDRVWHDMNRNGTQDLGEPGVSGIGVFLTDCNGNALASTTTDGSGNYLFSGLTPGNYQVDFDLSTLPAGYVVTAQNAGSDNIDSDADPVTGATTCTLLEPNEDDMTWDMGIYYPTASLGDFVWYDENQDGIQDQNELGIQGVKVELYDCAGNQLATTYTDADGFYGFYDLTPGDYTVEFEAPPGFLFSPQDQGTDDAFDSDADPSTGLTTCYTLAADEHNPTIDAGLYTEEKADLEIFKSADVQTVHELGLVTYTIQAYNRGPDAATNVEVTDLLPSDVTYQSHTAPIGTYDPVTGIWSIPTIPAGGSQILTITVQVDAGLVSNSFIDLGPAAGFNLFVLLDLEQPSSDTEGKAAVGRNAILSNYSVGDKLPPSGGTEDILIVGKNLTYTSGRVYSGNVVYGNWTNLPVPAVSYLDGTLRKDSPIDFPAARTYLRNLSATLRTAHVPNGTVTNSYGTLFLVGTDPILNVFKVDGNDLSAANNVDIDVPAGSVVLVNINRSNVSWTGGLTVHNTDISNVLYNFHRAHNLHISGIDVQGSILAPLAALDFPSGVVNGQVICRFMYGSGQFNNRLFMGNIPTDYEIVNVAEVTASDQDDPDSTPGNGDPAEDDQDYALVTVIPASDAPGWNPEGTLQNGDAFWTITRDAQGNLIAGTADGNVYRSYNGGSEWMPLTGDLEVDQVWALDVNGSGELYAATNKGLYLYNASNGNWSSAGLNGIDTRSLLFDGNTVYAGSYGQGVFKSSDAMMSWTQINNNLTNLQVLSLEKAGNDIFAATFGGKIARLESGSNNWTALDVDFDHIWTLTVTSNNVIYAGTYGDGVYRSSDNGNNWSKVNKDLPAKFIYNIVVDAQDNVYANTLKGGIYVLETSNNNWTTLGMEGLSVSVIYFDVEDNTLYAGTKSGEFFANLDGVTSAEDENNGLPTVFEMSQNYPNPFNPSTMINFSIAKEGNYTLKVFNLIGEEVATLVSDNLNQGTYSVSFDASRLTSGVYFYRLSGDNNVNFVKKMMLLK